MTKKNKIKIKDAGPHSDSLAYMGAGKNCKEEADAEKCDLWEVKCVLTLLKLAHNGLFCVKKFESALY